MKYSMEEMRKVLRSLSQHPIAFQRSYAKITGSVHAGLFLSQACYWSDIKEEEGGWFWKTRDQWYAETCIERDGQEKARKACVKIGVLEEELRGVPARLYYRVNWDKLAELTLAQDSTITPNKEGVLEPENTVLLPPTLRLTETIEEITSETIKSSHDEPETETPKTKAPNFSLFRKKYRHLSKRGVKSLKTNIKLYDEICAQYGEDRVLKILEIWVGEQDRDFLKTDVAGWVFLARGVHEFIEEGAGQEEAKPGRSYPQLTR